MKERMGHVLGIGLLLLCIVAVLPGQYGRWRADWKADRDWGRAAEQRVQNEKAAMSAMRQASPDPMTRLKEHGVELTYDASLQGHTLTVDYRLAAGAPVETVVPLWALPIPSAKLYDSESGKEVGSPRESGSGRNPGEPTSGYMRFERVSAVPAKPALEFPPVAIYLQPNRSHRWEVRRTAEESQAPIGQRITVAGVEFEVEQVRFAGRRVHVDYRQVTDPARVGFYLLSFRLRDGLGGNWASDQRLDEFPNPARPAESFDFIPWLSNTMAVEVANAILIIPGPTVPLEVK